MDSEVQAQDNNDNVENIPEDNSENEKLQRIIAFIKIQNFTLQKHSVRKWGSFEVAFAKQGMREWFQVPNTPWGWGFSIEEAAALTLAQIPGNQKHEEFFILYFGMGTLEELKRSIKGE